MKYACKMNVFIWKLSYMLWDNSMSESQTFATQLEPVRIVVKYCVKSHKKYEMLSSDSQMSFNSFSILRN